MATYAIGDIQGCYDTLERLLARIRFDRARDRLWLVGDLVNRGAGSLEVLRWAKGLGDRVVCVLGNHDLHLIACARGLRKPRPKDTLKPVLKAPDADSLVEWLRRRPLLHREGSFLLVHAGLLPQWSVTQAVALAREVEAALRAPSPRKALAALYDDGPLAWKEGLSERKRLQVALHAFTRLRTCRRNGRICPDFSGPPEDAPRGCLPWFDVPGRRTADAVVVCGHWAALGLKMKANLIAIDTGCVWGRSLTAVRLEDREVFQQRYAED